MFTRTKETLVEANPQLRPDLERPVVRAVEAFPVQEGSETRYCLRDPQRIAQHALILPPAAVFIVSLFDGTNTIQDIQQACARQFGGPIPLQNITDIVAKLDEELYLMSQRFEEAVAEIERGYFDAPVRPAFHAGMAYEGDPAKLSEHLSGLRDKAGESGSNGGGSALAALVSPHIDLHRGGPCFAHAYNELARHEPADLYLVFGTGHQSRSSLFIATTKPYDTPLGLMPADRDFIEEFSRRAPVNVFEEELLHRDEHSIEFQALWLRHVLGDREAKMVPILCGSLHRFVREERSPRDDAQVADTLDALREMIESYPGRVIVIAGADMSHVGKRFGDPGGIPEDELERVEREDREVIAAMESGEAEAFFESIATKKDRNNVCGLSPIYMTLDIVRPREGRLLNYDRAIEEDTESVVTFAGLSFYR
ncbi:MAG: AmmeMemoRadiSam system protein B [bacterium]|nr:AmmeMemoRadiSam system protein B [bacterium]